MDSHPVELIPKQVLWTSIIPPNASSPNSSAMKTQSFHLWLSQQLSSIPGVKGEKRLEDGGWAGVSATCALNSATDEAIPEEVMIEEPGSNGLWVLSC